MEIKTTGKIIEEIFIDIETWLSCDGEDDWRSWDSEYLEKYDKIKEKWSKLSLDNKDSGVLGR